MNVRKPKKTARARKADPPKLYIAAVLRPERTSHRVLGDWAAFVAESPDEAATRALDASRRWGGGYVVLTGTLTELAVPAAEYRRVRITEPVAGLEPQ